MGRWFKKSRSQPDPEILPKISFTRLVGELLQARLGGQPVEELGDLVLVTGEHVLRIDSLYSKYNANPYILHDVVNDYLDLVADTLAEVREIGPPIPLLRNEVEISPSQVRTSAFSGNLSVCLAEELANPPEGEKDFELLSASVPDEVWNLLYQIAFSELKVRFPKAEVEAAGRGSNQVIQIGSGEGWESSFILLPEYRDWVSRQLNAQPAFAMPLTGSVIAFSRDSLNERKREAVLACFDGDDALSDHLFWEEGGAIVSEPIIPSAR